jgi:HSP20 family protein
MTRKLTLLPALKDEIFSLTGDIENTLQRSLDQFFSNNFPSFEPGPLLGGTSNFPRLNVMKKSDHYLIQASVPGFTKEELTIELDKEPSGNYYVLSISGKKLPSTEQFETKDYICHEIRASQFRRTVILTDVSSEKLDASLDKGILNITIPKAIPPPSSTVKIDIK